MCKPESGCTYDMFFIPVLPHRNLRMPWPKPVHFSLPPNGLLFLLSDIACIYNHISNNIHASN